MQNWIIYLQKGCELLEPNLQDSQELVWLQPLSEWKFKCNQLYLIAVLYQWLQGMERDNCIRAEVWSSSSDGVCQNTLFVKMN
jgi:hypothetical protein